MADKNDEIDCKLVGLPEGLLNKANRLLDTEIPECFVDEDRIRPTCQTMTDEACDELADSKYNTMPEVIERKGAVLQGRDFLKALKQQSERAAGETLREYDRQPDRVPVSESEKLSFWGSFWKTLRSYGNYSSVAVGVLAVLITAYLLLEVVGVQVKTLTSSTETWINNGRAALGFSIAFSLSVVLSTRAYWKAFVDCLGEKGPTQQQIVARRWAFNWMAVSCGMLAIFGGFLAVIHIDTLRRRAGLRTWTRR